MRLYVAFIWHFRVFFCRAAVAGLAFLSEPAVSVAQPNTYRSYEIWTRIMLQKELSTRWEVTYAFNYRRQNNFLQDQENPFVFPQAYLHRLAFNYRTPGNYTFHLSPLL